MLLKWPEQKVFIDGQTDFYGDELTRTHGDIAGFDSGVARPAQEVGRVARDGARDRLAGARAGKGAGMEASGTATVRP